jgi:hypothetical protein
MTNSPTPTPNPNRRRRLTADELIAIGVALAGIGTVFFWGIGQKYQPMFQAGISSLTNDNNTRRPLGALGGQEQAATSERKTIASMTGDRQTSTTTTTTTTAIAPPVVKTVEVPAETAPAPTAVVPAIVAAAPIVTTPAFKDVPKQFWGETYITELQKRGILADFGTGKFDPDKEITRGEYAKMLDRAFADRAVTVATTPKFKDIPADYPRKEAIDKSVQLGFMTGYPSSKFAPNQPIPRYQMQISLAKGLQLAAPANTDPVLNKYADAKDMPKYARDKVAAAIESGIIIKDKTPNLLKPNQNATRADAAASIYEVLVKAGKIKPQAEN